jgi:aminopeptidase N
MPDTEITRAETSGRARLLRVRSYEVDLDFTQGPETFGSVSLIRFNCHEPGATTHADLIATGVREIMLNGVPLDPQTAWADGRITLPGLAGRNELRVVADCAYTTSGTGMHRADSGDGSVHIYAKLAQAYARTAYACFDQPDLKAVFTFQVTTPARWAVLSNQPQDHAEHPSAGSRTVRFLPTPPVPTFTTTVVAGDYYIVTTEHTTPDGQQIPLELACRASLARYLDADAVFALTRQGLDFYTGWLGSAYPFGKYGHVFVPEFPHLASENAGCVLISERLLFRSRASAAQLGSRTGTLLHEMAHMWFGDSATQEWWDDLWLSESFANFCEYFAQSSLGLSPDSWSIFSVAERLPCFAEDRLPSSHPIASGATTVSDAVANLDGITYAKGASVLRQLSAYAAEENFTAGLRAYLARHSYGTARLTDILAAVTDASGMDLAGWSQTWLKTAGPNVLRPSFETDGDGTFTSFAVLQEATSRHPVLRSHRVCIGLYSRSGDGALRRVRQVAAEIDGPRSELPELVGTAQPELIVLNDDDTAYVLVRFDDRSLRTVAGSVGDIPDLPARAACWTAVIDMVRQAELPVRTFARMLAGGMRTERSVRVLQALHAQAGNLIMTFADSRQAAQCRAILAGAAAELLWSAEPGSDHQLSWFELLSWTAANEDELQLLTALLDGTRAVPGLVLAAERRWTVLRHLAAVGEAGDARIDAELARDPTDAGLRNASGCRAAIPDPGHKEAAWRLLVHDRTGPETVTAVAEGLMQPEHADLLVPYAGRFLAEMPDLWRTRGGHMRVRLAKVLFPYPAVTSEFLARLDEFLAAEGSDRGLSRIVRDHCDTAERTLRARALDLSPGRR